jgi:tripartite-type tricarboxylate transporter receptor subunit TctC
VIVENRPGANGLIGNDMAAKAAPDGYAILFSNASAVVVNAALREKLPYDTLNDLAPVIQVSAGGVLLVVAVGIPVHDFNGFVEYVERHPDIAYGTWGVGSTGHLAMETIAAAKHLRMRHVPYKTMGQLLTDLQGGVVRLAFVDARSPIALIQAGKLIPIAMTGRRRAPMLAEIPTLKEQGFGFDLDGWYGFFVPASTPGAIVDRLNSEIARIMADPSSRSSLSQQGVTWIGRNSPGEFQRVIRNDILAWKKIVATAHIKAED